MKLKVTFLAAIIIAISLNIAAQTGQKFLDAYNFNPNKFGVKPGQYDGISGSPYLNNNFINSEIYLKDKTAYKLPIRYDIFKNCFEYQIDSTNYEIGNPELLEKIVIGPIIFVYIPFIEKGGYFELLVGGKCSLIKKYIVKFNDAKPPAPYQDAKPAEFKRGNDKLFLVLSNGQSAEIKNLKNVLEILADQRSLIETYLKNQKIKNVKKENLVKIVNYYNTL